MEIFPADMMELANEVPTNCGPPAPISTRRSWTAGPEGASHSSQELLRRAIRKGTIDNLMRPVVCGTSYKNKVCRSCWRHCGAICQPHRHSPHQGINPDTDVGRGAPLPPTTSPSPPGFKNRRRNPLWEAVLPFASIPGTAEHRHPCSTPKKQKERIGRILQMHANHREDIDTVYSGDIAAVIGLKNSTTATPSATRSTPSSWSPWSSPSRLSGWPLSPRPRPVRRRWASP